MTEEQRLLMARIRDKAKAQCRDLGRLACDLRAKGLQKHQAGNEDGALLQLLAAYTLAMHEGTGRAVAGELICSESAHDGARLDYLRVARAQVHKLRLDVAYAYRMANLDGNPRDNALLKLEESLDLLIALVYSEVQQQPDPGDCPICGRCKEPPGPRHALWCECWIPF